MNTTKRYTIDQARIAIRDSRSWRQAAYALGLNGDGGGNTQTLRTLAEEHNIDYSHFTGKRSNKGNHTWNYIPVEKLLKKGVVVKSTQLKKKLIAANILDDRCYECELEAEWNGKPINLELDHIDGDNTNNELSNLRILCPNCHSQTPSFRGRKQ